VLLGGLGPSASGPLPPLGGALPPVNARSSSAGGKPTKSLAPRIQELGQALVSGQPSKTKAACSELAMLATTSISACMAVADAKIEPQLSKVLLKDRDPSTQCWTMSVLANCAMNKASRERQAVAVPALCKLISSPNAEVQHAAALHLATLSHSDALTLSIAQNNKSMRTLYDLEKKTSETMAYPQYDSLRNEASKYARWALRTAQGRNYKPNFVPKSQEQLDYEASVNIQARVRSTYVANGYRKEMQARRAAATVLQAGYRGHGGRSAVAAQIMIEAPAAALLQGVMRGRKERKKRMEIKENKAATKVQAMTRGRTARKGRFASSGSAADADVAGEAGAPSGVDMEIMVKCSDGEIAVPLEASAKAEEYKVGFKITCTDGDFYCSVGIPITDGGGDDDDEDAEETEPAEPIFLFCPCSDGELRLRLQP